MPAASGESPPEAGGRGRARRLILWVLLPYLLLVGLRLLLSANLDCPLKPDELGYLGNARYLATGSGLVDPAGRHAYKVGYPLLLIPAFLLTDDPIGGFKAAQVLNAFLLSLVYPAAFLLAGRLAPSLARVDRLLLALCVSLYPAALLYSTTAMSANAFVPAFFLLLLAAMAALERPRAWSWAAFGAATVVLYAIHERAIGVVACALGTALLHLWRGSPGRRAPALAFFAAAPGAWLLLRAVEVPGSRWHTGSQSLQVLRGALANPETLLVTAAGQLWYLGLATLGSLFAGTLLLALARRRLATLAAVPGLFWPLLYGSAAAVFATSVLFNVVRWDQARFTHWVYGRQNESVLLPLLLVALLALRGAGDGRRWRDLAARGESQTAPRADLFRSLWSTEHFHPGLLASVLGTGLAIAAATAVLRYFWSPSVGPPYSFGASSLPIFSQPLGWGILRSTAVWGVGFLLLAALFARRWRWGVAALSLFFAVSTAVTYRDSWARRYPVAAGQRQLAGLVERFDPQRRVILHDRRVRPFHFHYYNLTYFLPDFAFRRLGERTLPTGDLVLSGGLDVGRSYPGARLAGLENFAARRTGYIHSLWVLPGPLQDALDRRGWLLPAEFPGRLDAEALRSELQPLEDPAGSPWNPGEERTLRLEAAHRGSTPWPHRGGLGSAGHGVGLAAVWVRAGTREMAARQWADLPRMLYPGDSAALEIRLQAAGAGGPLPAGAYRIRLAIAQESPESTTAAGLEVAVEVGE